MRGDTPATYDDANLMVRIMTWASGLGLLDAVTKVTAEDFDPATAKADDPAVQLILSLGETIGTFVKHRVLDEDLVRDLLWIEGIWERAGPAALAERARLGSPRMYENFEALARGAAS